MAKPVLSSVATFDATRDKVFRFQWFGSSIVSATLNIYNSSTDTTVTSYSEEISGSSYLVTLPANTISNNVSYYANLTTVDGYDNTSTVSNTISFKCVITPDFDLDIDSETILAATTAEVNVEYSHATETIKSLRYYLTDSDGNIIIETDDIFYEKSTDLTYRFTGLTNGNTYKAYATCETSGGLELETPIKTIIINCSTAEYGGKFLISNNKSDGYVSCNTEFVIIKYNGSEKFTIEDSTIDLRDKTLYYDEGFEVNDDFKICLRGNRFSEGKILNIGNGTDCDIVLYLNYYDDDIVAGYKLCLIVTYGKMKYVIYSDRFDMTSSTSYTYQFWITRKNGIYNLTVIDESEDDEDSEATA